MRFVFGLLMPMAEICLGWLWLARGAAPAGRLLAFGWWFGVATLLGFSFLLAVSKLVLDHKWPEHGIPPDRRYWLHGAHFMRIAAQIATGCPTLAIFSFISWLFCRLTMLIVADVTGTPGLRENR